MGREEAKALTPKQCAVIELALDTIKVFYDISVQQLAGRLMLLILIFKIFHFGLCFLNTRISLNLLKLTLTNISSFGNIYCESHKGLRIQSSFKPLYCCSVADKVSMHHAISVYAAILPCRWCGPEEDVLGKESRPAVSALRLVSVHPGHRQAN